MLCLQHSLFLATERFYLMWTTNKLPAPGQYIYIHHNPWLAGECIEHGQKTKVVLPNDITQQKTEIMEWLPLPIPGDSWIEWTKQEPSPGLFLWIRDPDYPKHYELAWSLGLPGKIKVVLPNDPSFSRITEKEWQEVPPPEIKK